MKVLVTGVDGQLGHDVMAELDRRQIEALGVDLPQMDITDKESVLKTIEDYGPDAVIHCAAWTAVDAAEDAVDQCRKVNAEGTANIAEACSRAGCSMMYISTDYVFDGQGTRPWEPDDPVTQPLNVYGLTKYEGEEAVRSFLDRYFIVRIAWVFGKNGKNFIRTMLNLSEKYQRITVVDDQYGTPTYTFDLARLLVDMILTDRYGIYHVTNEGDYITWYDFACEIFRQAGITMEVVPVSSAEYAARARRPENSRMNRSRITGEGFTPLPDWKDALGRYLKEIAE
ncbi:MAG: dTDP-4-dehydrorhamnose reductase [Eubacterium sp.]|nr:dTDP-4-dehydrorhamnose reductase [Eubacterium sp.]